eukprot:6210634-Pleurochrysis_carterae.AAC.1
MQFTSTPWQARAKSVEAHRHKHAHALGHTRAHAHRYRCAVARPRARSHDRRWVFALREARDGSQTLMVNTRGRESANVARMGRDRHGCGGAGWSEAMHAGRVSMHGHSTKQ